MRTINRPIRIFLIITAFVVAGLCFNNVFGKERKDTLVDDDSSVCSSIIDINITSDNENESVIVILNGELLAMATDSDQSYSINCIVVTKGEKDFPQINVRNTKSTSEADADPELEDWMFEVVNSGNEPDTLEKEEEIRVEEWMTNLSTWTIDG